MRLPRQVIVSNDRNPYDSVPYSRTAWTGQRASPSFSPGASPRIPPNGPPPGSQGAFPPLSLAANGPRPQDNPQERILQSLSGLTVRSHYF